VLFGDSPPAATANLEVPQLLILYRPVLKSATSAHADPSYCSVFAGPGLPATAGISERAAWYVQPDAQRFADHTGNNSGNLRRPEQHGTNAG